METVQVVDESTRTVDHPQQSKLVAQMAVRRGLLTLGDMLPWKPAPGKHVRSGVTKSKGQRRNKTRTRMAKASRRRNRR